MTKYKAAAKIVNSTLLMGVPDEFHEVSATASDVTNDTVFVPCVDAIAAVVEKCKAGAKVVDLCDAGDSFVTE